MTFLLALLLIVFPIGIAEVIFSIIYTAVPCIAKKGNKDVITFVYVRRKYAKYIIEDKKNLVDVEVKY